jgi:hypothetical protein
VSCVVDGGREGAELQQRYGGLQAHEESTLQASLTASNNERSGLRRRLSVSYATLARQTGGQLTKLTLECVGVAEGQSSANSEIFVGGALKDLRRAATRPQSDPEKRAFKVGSANGTGDTTSLYSQSCNCAGRHSPSSRCPICIIAPWMV